MWPQRRGSTPKSRGREVRRYMLGPALSIVCGLSAIHPAAVHGQGRTSVIEGFLLEGDRSQPGIEVYLSGTSFQTVSDSTGRFRFSGLAPGTYRIAVAFMGPDGPLPGPAPMPIDLGPGEVERITLRIRVAEDLVRLTPPPPLTSESPPSALQEPPTAARTDPVALLLRVTSAGTGDPIPATAVWIDDGSGRLTNDEGRARWGEIRSGEHVLRLQHPGFGTHEERIVVGRDPVAFVEIALDERAVRIEGVEVVGRRRRGIEGRLAGFYQRMETHYGGRFVTREQLEPRDSQPLLMVLQSLIPNLRQYCVKRGTLPFCRLESSRRILSFSGGRGCRPTVYVDGVRFQMPEWTNLEEIFTPAAIEAVEFYPGAGSIPVEFNSSNARCGVLVIWSRES